MSRCFKMFSTSGSPFPVVSPLMLSSLSHPNLPQLIGLSDASTPIPFVLLTGAQTRTPEAFMLEALRNASLAFCAELILRLVRASPPFASHDDRTHVRQQYRDVSEAALYTQEEMSYSDAETQDFLEVRLPFAVQRCAPFSRRLDRPRAIVWTRSTVSSSVSRHRRTGSGQPCGTMAWLIRCSRSRSRSARHVVLSPPLTLRSVQMLPNCAYDMHLHRQEDPESALSLPRSLSPR
jgi:hypothetical protein